MQQGSDAAPLTQRLRWWADELRAISNEGLHWSAEHPYDVSRYRRVLRIAAELLGAQDIRDAETIERLFTGDLTHRAPYPTADAAVFDHRQHILLIRRRDSGLWAMPGGLLEVGETPAEGACRETWEETGLLIEPVALSGVYDSRFRGGRHSAHLYQFVFLCRPLDPRALPRVSDETLDVGWYQEADMPDRDPDHLRPITEAFQRMRGELPDALFDWHGWTPGEGR